MKTKEKKNESLFLPSVTISVAFCIVVLPFWIWSGEGNVFYTLSAIGVACFWISYAYQKFREKGKQIVES